jgi:acyl-CoA reductase-like NAD-dependent aldehyde dehydrogenase
VSRSTRKPSGSDSPSSAPPPAATRPRTVWINDHIPLVSEMPHGGFKQSGYGKDLSAYSLEDYTQIKHVMVRLD